MKELNVDKIKSFLLENIKKRKEEASHMERMGCNVTGTKIPVIGHCNRQKIAESSKIASSVFKNEQVTIAIDDWAKILVGNDNHAKPKKVNRCMMGSDHSSKLIYEEPLTTTESEYSTVDGLSIGVLRTKSNVANHPQDSNEDASLFEGSLEVQLMEGEESDLKSIIKAEWNRSTDQVLSLENVNRISSTTMVEGKLVFRNTSFQKIKNTLENRYNVNIVNNDKNLDKQLFDATFDIETIDQILESL